MSLPDVHWWLADVMDLADAKGPEVAQRCTLARLPLLASQAQLFKPPSSPGAADVAVAKGFLGAYLKLQGRCVEDETVAASTVSPRKRERSPIGLSVLHGERSKPRRTHPAKGRSPPERLAIRGQEKNTERTPLALRQG